MAVVIDDQLGRFLGCQLLELGEGLGLPHREADDDLPVDLPPRLPGQVQLLQLGQGGADLLLRDQPPHLGRRALYQSLQSGANTSRSREVFAVSEASSQNQGSARCDEDKGGQENDWNEYIRLIFPHRRQVSEADKILICYEKQYHAGRPGK